MSKSPNNAPMSNSPLYKNNDKDTLINELKSQVFALEQSSKDYNALQAKYRQTSNELALVTEERNRLEYELKQKSDSTSKIISEYQLEKENLQSALNEKLAINKTLFNDNNSLFSSLEAKNLEVENLKEALNERDDIIAHLQEEKHKFECNTNDLADIKKANETQICKMKTDLEHLNKICEDQDKLITNLNNDKKKLIDNLTSVNFENKNLIQKLKGTSEKLTITSQQLDDANKTIMRLNDDLNKTQEALHQTSNDLDNATNQLNVEKRAHAEFEDKANDLDKALKEKLNEIKNMNIEIVSLNENVDRLSQDKFKNNNDIDKYKAHITFLTEIIQKLTNELEEVVERDKKLKIILCQGDKIREVLINNRNDIDAALNNLELSLSGKKCEK